MSFFTAARHLISALVMIRIPKGGVYLVNTTKCPEIVCNAVRTRDERDNYQTIPPNPYTYRLTPKKTFAL